MSLIIRVFLPAAAAMMAVAQPASKLLTLEDCIRLAQSAQSAVSIARQETEIARRGVALARSGFLPQAHWANGFTYNSPLRNSSGEFSYVALNGVREYVSLVNVGLELDTSGRLRAGLARAAADRDAAGSNLMIAQRDLKRAVTAAYYRLLLARHLIEAARDSLAEARAFEERTRLLVEQGEAAQADNVKAAAQTAFLQQALNGAQLDAEVANHDLASFWTTDVNERLEVVDTLAVPAPPPEAPETTANPFLRRFEFSLLDAQKRGFQADARRARADLFPQTSFNFQYGIDALRVSLRERGSAAFVNLTIPVFDWFKALGATRQFRLREQQVEASRQVATRAFSRDYQDALAKVKMVHRQIALTDEQVKLSEKNLELSRVRYEGGEGPALDVVAAQAQLAQARGNHYVALANYLNARADLEVASAR